MKQQSPAKNALVVLIFIVVAILVYILTTNDFFRRPLTLASCSNCAVLDQRLPSPSGKYSLLVIRDNGWTKGSGYFTATVSDTSNSALFSPPKAYYPASMTPTAFAWDTNDNLWAYAQQYQGFHVYLQQQNWQEVFVPDGVVTNTALCPPPQFLTIDPIIAHYFPKCSF